MDKLKESLKKNKEFDLVEHEVLKYAFIFNKIINNSEKETEGVDNTDGINDILCAIKNNLIALIHSDIKTINNPILKKVIKTLKSLVGFLNVSKDKINNENVKKEEQPLIQNGEN